MIIGGGIGSAALPILLGKMSAVALIRKTGASTELGYHFDLANDGFVEGSEILSRNPVSQAIFPPASWTR